MSADNSIERMFPFVLRARKLIAGRDTIYRSRHKLQFVLITEDISETSKKEILETFKHYPIVQHYDSAQLETFFKLQNAKVVGFIKSSLGTSIYRGLKDYRINEPVGVLPPEDETAVVEAKPEKE